jgi:addiction module HigA family antidote
MKPTFPHPGALLREEFLETMGLTPYRLAKDIGVPLTRITAILAEARGVTADTGLRLDRYFGLSEGYWLGLQQDSGLLIPTLDFRWTWNLPDTIPLKPGPHSRVFFDKVGPWWCQEQGQAISTRSGVLRLRSAPGQTRLGANLGTDQTARAGGSLKRGAEAVADFLVPASRRECRRVFVLNLDP